MQTVGTDFWIKRVDHSVPVFGNLGACASIIRYAPDQVLIISPVPFTDDEKRQIAGFGNVSWLISPNPAHHLYIGDAQAAFPTARIAGSQEAARKRTDLKFDLIFEGHGPLPWTESVLTFQIPARKPLFEEYVFYHHPTGTMVVTDLLFNLHGPASLVNRLARKINGIDRHLAMSHIGKMLFNDQSAVRSTVNEILRLKPRNLIMAHGEPVIGEAEDALHHGLHWLLH